MSDNKFDIEKLKTFKDSKIELVKCPEWESVGFGEIYVRSMSGKARDAYELAIYEAGKDNSKPYNMRASIVVATACDENGTELFSQNDAEWLGNMSAKVLDRIVDKAQELSGISEGDIDEMEKHLEDGQS